MVNSTVLPAGTVSLGEEALSGIPVAYLELPATLTDIADTAFDGCDGFIIYGTAGSEAQRYATVWGYQFAEE